MKTTIFFITTVDWYFFTHRLHLAETLLNNQYSVFLVSAFNENKSIIEQKGIKTLDFYTPQSYIALQDGWNLLKLIHLINKFKPNIIHAIALKPMLISALISPLFPQVKFIHAISGLGSSFSSTNPRSKLKVITKFRIMNLLLKRENNLVIVQNKSDYETLTKYIDPNRLYLIRGSGVDTDLFQPHSQAIKISELAVIKILLPCRLIWEKGIQYYAQAAQILADKYPQKFEFDIAGRLYPANRFSVSEAEIKELEQQYPVKWLGNLEAMEKQYLNYQIICLPTFYNEGIPRVLIEAASCGIPCITTDHPGCNDIIVNNYNGKIIPVKDAQAIAQAIEDIVADDNFYLELSRNARQRVIDNFSSKLINQATISLYQN